MSKTEIIQLCHKLFVGVKDNPSEVLGVVPAI